MRPMCTANTSGRASPCHMQHTATGKGQGQYQGTIISNRTLFIILHHLYNHMSDTVRPFSILKVFPVGAAVEFYLF